ncbi:PRC-barrel domain-containing protein [Burkholderia pseudomultivorans]|uniref:PRC-barrel domain protein n=2 Tax=Burkholderia cepacia complex TaxID=87882 RepID=A0AAN0RUR6_9BURK|nr:PRC-barrel domain-containing protein [Burkholderia pseudomultivorans]AIO34322.1 PRC-barrel domain protein [Burkholderia cenocepacia]AOI92945.1 photosystem reaction center subunit H [Burkholderia pseudomultivorans]KVC16740.1 photosystem reaction center subunit H [Burkholderia pseudomultivorans]KVC35076.1 photosystem reaction center subunit H [Burkholderia pseudomultivorans]KVC53028.1 photosystem reaction center subunit H [Burkholderia pseudomultivorans]
MSGGLPFPASRKSFPSSTVFLILAAAALLSGCGLLPVQNPPAPISEALVEPVEETAGEPLTMPPVPAPTRPEEPEAPKKPHREVARPKPVQRPESPTPPPPPPPPIVGTRPLDRTQIHALLDSEVARRNGKVIGRAVDMVTDPSGKPREMIVNLQGFMGVGDRKVSFPWNVFRFTPGGKQEPIVLDVPSGDLPPAARPKAVPLSGSAAASPATRLPLLDSDVERPNGTKIGRVVDVLIDRAAEPQAVVLDLGGLVNTDRRSIAASWGALRFVMRDKALRPQLDLNDAQIKAAPPYAADKPIVAVYPPVAPAPASTASTTR